MPGQCSRCNHPLQPGARFCGECGAPAGISHETAGPVYIPLLELHSGILGAGRTTVVMQVSPGELLLFSLPEYFIDTVEELRERLDDTLLKVWDTGGDWKATLDAWNWKSEDVITGIEEVRDDLVAGGTDVRSLKNSDIRSVFIEQIESDSVWDIMTIDSAGKKIVLDFIGPVAWYAFQSLKAVLGDRVVYQEN